MSVDIVKVWAYTVTSNMFTIQLAVHSIVSYSSSNSTALMPLNDQFRLVNSCSASQPTGRQSCLDILY